jgi:hypothetical protein
MDVSNLIPSQDGARSTAGAAARGKPDAAEAPAQAMAAAASAGSVTPRPAAPTSAVSDRVERSEELSRRIAELKIELERRSAASARRTAEVRRDIQESKEASHETLVRAALGILRGELFYFES